MELNITNNQELHRFEFIENGIEAVLEYKQSRNRIYLIHTGVPKEFSGRGIAAALATTALNYARENDLEAVIICPYVKAYVKRHPELLEGLKHSFYPPPENK